MDLLFRFGGLLGAEMGAQLGVGCSVVSQEWKRLRESREKDRQFDKLVRRFEGKLSRIKI
jgi:hypothetical protein